MADSTQLDDCDPISHAIYELQKGKLELANSFFDDPTFRPRALKLHASKVVTESGEGGLMVILIYLVLLARRDYAGVLDFTKDHIASLAAGEVDQRYKLTSFYEHRATLFWFAAEYGRSDELYEAWTLLLGAGLAIDPSSYIYAEKLLAYRMPREGRTDRKPFEGEHPG